MLDFITQLGNRRFALISQCDQSPNSRKCLDESDSLSFLLQLASRFRSTPVCVLDLDESIEYAYFNGVLAARRFGRYTP